MDFPSVIVVILNWNRWKDTIECLTSVQASNYANFQIVIIDNASTDNSVREISHAFPSLTLLQSKENKGYSAGANIGLKFALDRDPEFIWLLNNDVLVDPNALGAMVRRAERDQSIGAIGSVIYDADPPDRIQAWGGAHVTPLTGRIVRHSGPVAQKKLDYLIGASVLIRREAVAGIGLLDENYFLYWEDVDLGYRLRRAGWELAVCEEAKVWHKETRTLGKKSPLTDQYFSHTSIRFFRLHRRLPFVPIALSFLTRLGKRTLLRDWDRARAVCRGTWFGLRGKPVSPPERAQSHV